MTKTFYAGDTNVIYFSALNTDGDALPLSGIEITWALSDINKKTILISLTNEDDGGITVTDADEGKFEVYLPEDDTVDLVGDYYHEVQINGPDLETYTIYSGTIRFLKTIINPTI